MIINIDYKGKEYKFRTDMYIWQYHKWRKEFGIDPETTLPDWWMKKSEFGLYILHKLLTNGVKVLDIDEEDWELFFPVFHHYFVTPTEFDAIKNNVMFWNGKSEKVYENSSFIDWVLTEQYQILSDEDRKNMGFKNQMILYYYAVLNRVTQNAQDIADRLGYVPENQEKEPEENMYG
jgi:hypothetical protein